MVQSWLAFTSIKKGNLSSAGFHPNWVSVANRPTKRDKQAIAKAAAEWDLNPHPKVTAASVLPSHVPAKFIVWPAIPSLPESNLSRGEPDPKRLHVDTSLFSGEPIVESPTLSEIIVYDWPGGSSSGCHHYCDSSYWKAYFET